MDFTLIKEGETEIEIHGMTRHDYIYCEDCDEYVDLWKYGKVSASGHEDCHWRYVTVEELRNCVKDCIAGGCFRD